ncbi:hypothetical protein VTI74DRAFT_6710 [Chaetomium olivicolor]
MPRGRFNFSFNSPPTQPRNSNPGPEQPYIPPTYRFNSNSGEAQPDFPAPLAQVGRSSPSASQPFNFNSPISPAQPSQSFSFTFSDVSGRASRNRQFQFTGANPTQPSSSNPIPTAQTTTHRNTSLCPPCSTLDLETALARAHSLYENARRDRNTRRLVTCRSSGPNRPIYLRDFYFVTSLGRRLSSSAPSSSRNCKLCDFFRQNITGDSNSTEVGYKLLAICSSESYLFQPPRKDACGRWLKRESWDDLEFEYNVFVAVVPEVEGVPRTGLPLRWLEMELPKVGAIYRLTKPLGGEQRVVLPRVVRAEADMAWVKRCLACCRGNHRVCCAPRKPDGATMTGFRVIDCAKEPPVVVEVPWSEKYVALSYVWGSLKGDWPRTVTDAVHVTKALGEKYLWVDRLCIDQSNFDEKMALIARMGDIYAGAEFTIVNAAGDAGTGLPGVLGTPRIPQPRVELDRKPGGNRGAANSWAEEDPGDAYLDLLNVPVAEYERETEGHSLWLDTFRHGLDNVMKIDLSELTIQDESEERARKYGISLEDLDFYQDWALDSNIPFDEFMEKQKLLATTIGITIPELVPYFKRKIASDTGQPIPDGEPLPRLSHPDEYITNPSKPLTPLPPGATPGKTILLSTLPSPQHTIRHSVWATRGWTYQEGVLSTRRLVFTPHQLYWECNGMAIHESIALPMKTLHVPSDDRTHLHFADYMLSGIFRGDVRAVPELQYGFREEAGHGVDGEVKRLDAHLRAYTSRKLTNAGDSLDAFLGVAARYAPGRDSQGGGLALLQGMPVWTGLFADGRRAALQDTFAFSVSVWFHVARPVERHAELFVVDCPRRACFPSWSWIGWEGAVEFNGDNMVEEGNRPEEDDQDCQGDNAHVDFFMAMLQPEWISSVDRLWSAEMVLHSEDGSHSTILSGQVPNLGDFAGGGKNSGKKWLLTVKDPLVVKHLYLMHSSRGRWKRLMGKVAELHLSVSITEEELTVGHKAGNLVSVLIFAGTVPFVWDGRARFLILRKVDASGNRWERIGRLVLTIEEWMMGKYKDSAQMVNDLPVRKFGKDITLI